MDIDRFDPSQPAEEVDDTCDTGLCRGAGCRLGEGVGFGVRCRIEERQGRAHGLRGRHGSDLVRGTVGDDPTAGDEDDAVGEFVGLLEVVGGEEDRLAGQGDGLGGCPETMR